MRLIINGLVKTTRLVIDEHTKLILYLQKRSNCTMMNSQFIERFRSLKDKVSLEFNECGNYEQAKKDIDYIADCIGTDTMTKQAGRRIIDKLDFLCLVAGIQGYMQGFYRETIANYIQDVIR